MPIQQISIFLENRPGQLADVLCFMESKGIDMLMYNLVETVDCGILRVLVKDVDAAIIALQAGGYDARIKKLIGLLVPDIPGATVKAFQALGSAGINVRYSYAYALQNKQSAAVLFKVDDNEKAEILLEQAGLLLLCQAELL